MIIVCIRRVCQCDPLGQSHAVENLRTIEIVAAHASVHDKKQRTAVKEQGMLGLTVRGCQSCGGCERLLPATSTERCPMLLLDAGKHNGQAISRKVRECISCSNLKTENQ